MAGQHVNSPAGTSWPAAAPTVTCCTGMPPGTSSVALTIDAAFDVTIADASVSDYTLTVMTWVAGFGLPVVLGYQAWTYWVFRKRLTAQTPHETVSA